MLIYMYVPDSKIQPLIINDTIIKMSCGINFGLLLNSPASAPEHRILYLNGG